MTIGAPQRCVTPCSAMRSKIGLARTWRRHTCTPGLDADRPGKAPAVAMEHRQRPEIDGMAADVGGDDIADREQIGAAMVVDDALGIAGRARGVIERDRVPFVDGRRALVSLVALGDQSLVFELAQPLAGAVVFGIVVIDDAAARTLASFSAAPMTAGEFAVDDERLGLAMVEHEGDRGRVEAGVERVEHGAAHRDAIVAFEHRGRVGEHDRDRVAAHDAPPGERRGELLRPRVELAIVAAQRPVDDRQPIRETRRRRAPERSAASAADNWRDCDRGRDHRAKGASGGAPRRFDAIIAR